LTGAALGQLALLLAFSFSLALSRYEARRKWVLEEANAIGSTANLHSCYQSQNKGPSSADYAAKPPCELASRLSMTRPSWRVMLPALSSCKTSCGSML
jgi:hypothetical protein